MLFVNEIFASIQGEGAFTGMPSVFVRLQGCDVRCPWCDTKHTWRTGVVNEHPLSFAAEKQDAPRWASCHEEELIEYVIRTYPNVPHVVITGGEPLMQGISTFVAGLLRYGKSVQIETSGTRKIDLPASVWVTVSPKFDINKERPVLDEALSRADEIKAVVDNHEDVNHLVENIDRLGIDHQKVALQPLSCKEDATRVCVESAMVFGFRVSLQMHKFLKVR